MARSRTRKARQKAYNRHRQQHPRGRNNHPSEGQDTLEEKYPIQEDKEKKRDALDYAVSGGHFESNRRKH